MTRSARAALVLLAAGAALVPLPRGLVERWYSLRMYPALQRAMTPVSNLVPFALFDVLLIAAICALAIVTYRLVRRDGWVRGCVRLSGVVLTAAAAVYLLFIVTWGLNYRRVPMVEKFAFDASRVNRDAAR